MQTGVFNIGLDDNGAPAVALMIFEEADSALEIDRVQHAVFFNLRFDVHADDVFSNREPGAGKGRTDGQSLPVVLGDIGGADPRDDPGELELDTLVMTERNVQPGIREIAWSLSGSIPWAPMTPLMMLKCE